MKKLAIFVEGQTELLFLEKLLAELAKQDQLRIESWRCSGGSSCKFKMVQLRQAGSVSAKWFVQLLDCTSDGNVKSYIRERYESLVAAGFSEIIGIRDCYPSTMLAGVASLRVNLMLYLRTIPVRPTFVLGVMELESWFIAEASHFARVDPRLDAATVQATLGYDPATFDICLRPHPASDLDMVYSSIGLRYSKSYSSASRTILAIDYTSMYLQVRLRFEDLNRLLDVIEQFLT